MSIFIIIIILQKSKYFINRYESSSISIKTISESNKSPKNSNEMDSNTETIENIESNEQPMRNAKRIRREVKVAKTLAIITIAYIICLLPFNGYILYNIIANKNNTKLGLDITLWLLFLNSTVNPILYAYFNKNFRKAFKDILISWKFIKQTLSSRI